MTNEPSPPPASGDINIEELEALESTLSNLEDELYVLRGTSSSNVKREKKEQQLGDDESVYAFGRRGDDEIDIKKLRKTIMSADLSSICVYAGQLVAAQLLSKTSIYEITFEPGENVIPADGGQRLFARRDGLVHWHGDRVDISPLKKVNGDATVKTGNINTKGSIIIDGSVESGLFLKAGGDIYVGGNVGKSKLQATGNIVVRNGIVGSDGGLIKAGGDVMAKFVEHGTIDATGNVIITDAIMHSNVTAGGSVVCVGEKAVIVGGEIRASDEVNCKELGSSAGTETSVAVGAKAADRQIMQQITQEIADAEKAAKAAEKNVNTLLAQKSAGTFDGEKQKKLDAQTAEKKKQQAILKELQAQKIEVEGRVAEGKSGRICVSQIAHAGVKMIVGRADGMTLKKETKRVGFVEVRGKIVGDTYADPKIKRSARIRTIDLADSEGEQAAGTAEMEDANVVQAELAKLRRSIVVSATGANHALRQTAHFLEIPEDQLHAEALPEVETKGKKKKTGKIEKNKGDDKSEGEEKHRHRNYVVFQVREGESPAMVARKYVPTDKKKEVRITCETIEDGLKRGAAALKLPLAKVSYRVVQQKSKGILGVGAKPYIIAVKMKKEPKREANLAGGGKKKRGIPSDALAKMSENSDGSYTIVNTDEGLSLTVWPAKGEGIEIEAGVIKQELNERKYRREISNEMVTMAVKEASMQPVIIGPRQPEPELDGSFKIEISDDKLKCTVTVENAKPMGKAIAVEEVIAALGDKGIANPNLGAVQEIFAKELYGKEIVVAEGVPAVQGKDGYWDFKFDVEKDKIKLEEDEKGQVDFHELNLVENVTEGQLLAEKVPPVMGQSGINVFGTEIPAVNGKESTLGSGKSTRLSDDGMQIHATANGQVMLLGKVIKVEPIYTVNGDVNLETGNISFLGSVIVTGAVTTGFAVRAAGDIHAKNVENATLEAEGNIVIASGIMGHNEAVLKAENDIKCKFVESGNLFAGRDIVVQEAILHSNVNASRFVICKAGKRGVIVGGTVRAGEGIDAKEIGSKVSTKTVIEVGMDPRARQQIHELEEQLKDNHANFRKVHLGIKALLAAKARGPLPEPKQALLVQLKGVATQLHGRLKRAQEQLEELQLKLKERESGKVSAHDRCYTGARITVRNATLQIDKDVQYSSFVYEGGEVRIKEYEELKVKSDTDQPDGVGGGE